MGDSASSGAFELAKERNLLMTNDGQDIYGVLTHTQGVNILSLCLFRLPFGGILVQRKDRFRSRVDGGHVSDDPGPRVIGRSDSRYQTSLSSIPTSLRP